MTQIITTPYEMKDLRKKLAGSVGFVPTMGALHHGHESLLSRARKENDSVILSIFVNPTQFNNPKDLEKYPKTFEHDLELAQKNKVDFLFNPNFSEMYPDNYRYKISENDLSLKLCGQSRPGHFDGVLTIVMKLLNLTQPDNAYFGEKDFQQLSLVQGMCQAFFMKTKIVPVKTIREESGLALSSRNMRLTKEEKSKAPLIFDAIKNAKSSSEAKEKLQSLGFQVDYVEDINNRRFVAAYLGEVRLIDNVQI